MSLREFVQTRTSLLPNNPATAVQLYLLTDGGGIEQDFGEFAMQVADLQDILYESDYWTRIYSSVPFPTNSSTSFPPRVFYLLKVDEARFNDYLIATHGESGGMILR